jgi:SAM-dependent methyltransferase
MQRDLVRKGYNKMVWKYLAERDKLKSGKYVQKILKLLPKNSTILDVGCGAGIPVDDLLIKAGHTVLGIDNSEMMVEAARRNCPGGEYELRDIMELGEGEYQVTAIVSFYALFHIPRERLERVLRTLVGYVQSGGYLLITLGDKDFEGEHEMYGERMWSSQWGTERNREIVKKLDLEIILDEVDHSGGEAHQIMILKKHR